MGEKKLKKRVFISIIFILLIILGFQSNVQAASKIKISKCKISLAKTSYSYTGAEIKPAVTVKYKIKKLKLKKDYTISYKNNKKAGTAIVTIKGKGKYIGSVKKTFKINKLKTSKTKITLSKTNYTYTGKTIKPGVTVKIGKVTLKNGIDYTVSYSNNKNVGTGTVTVKGKGSLTGTVKINFKISPVNNNNNNNNNDDNNGNTPNPEIPNPEPNYYGNFDAGELFLKIGDDACLNYRNDLEGKTIKSLSSSNTNVAIVTEWNSGLSGTRLNSVNKCDVYIDVVGAGNAEVIAEATDGTIGKCKIRVQDAGITVTANETTYKTEPDGVENGNVIFGQSASSVIGAKGLEMTNGYEYNHPSGLAYYKDENTGTIYFVVTDAWNNRVLVYTGSNIENATSKDPTYILGQKDENTSRPGYKLYEMNWPMDCAIDSKGRLYIADTHNNRILVYDDITEFKTTTDEESKTRITADHEIGWWNKEKVDHNDHIYWPWSVAVANVDETEKLIVTSTLSHSILIWNEMPNTWEETDPKYYPDLILKTEESSTPRTITWTGTQLIIGDENIRDYGAGLRIFNSFPTVGNLESKTGVTKNAKGYQTILTSANSKNLEDFLLTNPGAEGFNGGYGEGTMINGKLYMAFGCAMHVWNDGRIDSETDSGIYTFQIKENTYTQEGGCFLNGGGIYKLLYAENNLYLALHNGNYITGWKNVGNDKLISTSNETFRETSNPDIYVGTQEFKNNTKNLPASQYVKHNPIPLTDGEHLVVIDDLDQQVMVYKNIPTSSGAIADYVYNMPYELGEGAIRKYEENGVLKTALIIQSRTHNVIYIWTDYKFDGSMPDRVIGNNIGSKHLTGELIHIEFDGKYTYISTVINDNPQVLIYEGLVTKTQEPVSRINGSIENEYIHDNELSISSNGEFVSFMYKGKQAYIFQTTQFENSTLTLDNAYGVVNNFKLGEIEPIPNDYPGNYILYKKEAEKEYYERPTIGMLARTLITEDNKFIVTDTAEDRVFVWNSIEDAISKEEPIILGHGENVYDMDELIGTSGGHDIQEATFADTFYMPLYVAYDGHNLWVGEFKFSNRLLRFALK